MIVRREKHEESQYYDVSEEVGTYFFADMRGGRDMTMCKATEKFFRDWQDISF